MGFVHIYMTVVMVLNRLQSCPNCLFVCVEALQPSQPNGVISSMFSLPHHNFTGQAYSSKRLTTVVHIHLPETAQIDKRNYDDIIHVARY